MIEPVENECPYRDQCYDGYSGDYVCGWIIANTVRWCAKAVRFEMQQAGPVREGK